MNQIRILNTVMAIKETCEALLSYAEGLDAYIEGKENQEDFEIASRELANGLINLASVIHNLPSTENIPPPSPACKLAGEMAFHDALRIGKTRDEAIKAAEKAFDEQSDSELITAGLLRPRA